MVAEEGALPAAEAVEGHGDGDGHVDADHADLDAVDEVAGGVAVAGEDGGPVAVFVVVDHLEGGFEVVDTDDSEDGAEDLFAVDLHLGLYVVEEAGSEEEAFAPGQGGLAAVDDELSALLCAVLDVVRDAFEMGLVTSGPSSAPSFMPSLTWSFSMRCSSLPRRASAVALPTVTATEIAMQRSPAEP